MPAHMHAHSAYAPTHKCTHLTNIYNMDVLMCNLNDGHLVCDPLCHLCLHTIRAAEPTSFIRALSLCLSLPLCPVFCYESVSDICLSAKTNKSAKLLLKMIARPKTLISPLTSTALLSYAASYLADLMTRCCLSRLSPSLATSDCKQ